jgi:nucleotide-binding universal stress UspA family protein
MIDSLDKVALTIGPNERTAVDDLLDIVEAVAGPALATVYLLHVFERDEYDELMERMGMDATSGAIQPDELAERHDGVQTPAKRLTEQGLDCEVRGTIGDPESEVVRVAKELDIDLLFIGGGGRTPIKKAIFGNSAQQILLNAPCPVTYVRRDR